MAGSDLSPCAPLGAPVVRIIGHTPIQRAAAQPDEELTNLGRELLGGAGDLARSHQHMVGGLTGLSDRTVDRRDARRQRLRARSRHLDVLRDLARRRALLLDRTGNRRRHFVDLAHGYPHLLD